jgi:hypothetical protein
MITVTSHDSIMSATPRQQPVTVIRLCHWQAVTCDSSRSLPRVTRDSRASCTMASSGTARQIDSVKRRAPLAQAAARHSLSISPAGSCFTAGPLAESSDSAFIFQPKGVTRAFPSNMIAWCESSDRTARSSAEQAKGLFFFFVTEKKSFFVTEKKANLA